MASTSTSRGEAQRIEYDGRADQVRFIGQAVLRRYRGSTLSDETAGGLIVYDNQAEVFRVDGGPASASAANPSGRVRATLAPRSQVLPQPGKPVTLQPSGSVGEQAVSAPVVSRLEARGWQKSYGSRMVVRDVSLAVQSGEVVGLLGPNGAGKTTSFYMIVGLVRVDAGQILLDGQPIENLPTIAGPTRPGATCRRRPRSSASSTSRITSAPCSSCRPRRPAAPPKPRSSAPAGPCSRVAHRAPGTTPAPALGRRRRRVEVLARWRPIRASSCSTSPLRASIRCGDRDPAHHRLPDRARHRCADHRPQRARDAGHLRPRRIISEGRVLAPRHAAEIVENPMIAPGLSRRAFPDEAPMSMKPGCRCRVSQQLALTPQLQSIRPAVAVHARDGAGSRADARREPFPRARTEEAEREQHGLGRRQSGQPGRYIQRVRASTDLVRPLAGPEGETAAASSEPAAAAGDEAGLTGARLGGRRHGRSAPTMASEGEARRRPRDDEGGASAIDLRASMSRCRTICTSRRCRCGWLTTSAPRFTT